MKKNKFLILLITCGVLLFAIVTFVVLRASATVTAIVPNQNIPAGTKIEASMIDTIQVPVNTPKGYIIDKTSVLGQKLKVSVNQNQLLYISDIMTSWDDFDNGEIIPDDYVVTSIQIPAERAVGGLITAGDTVDILGVVNNNYRNTSIDQIESGLGSIAETSYGGTGTRLYWVLSNVLILETDSTLSQSNKSSISAVTGEIESNQGDFYIVALSYDDLKRLRLAETYLDLWMNITPAQNAENDPLIDEMKDNQMNTLMDSQKQSKIEKGEE